jgi:uncharacterized membrane protein HdeD (DUF308 family)
MTNKKQALLGHLMVILGCYALTWGIYLAPISEPTFIGIILKPLFWGLILILSGICVIVHSYCACIRGGKCPMKK